MDDDLSEGDLKTVKIKSIKLDPAGFTMMDDGDKQFRNISWKEIRKIRGEYNPKRRCMYYTFKLIDKGDVWINSGMPRKKGLRILKQMKGYLGSYRRGGKMELKELSGDFLFIYCEEKHPG